MRSTDQTGVSVCLCVHLAGIIGMPTSVSVCLSVCVSIWPGSYVVPTGVSVCLSVCVSTWPG